MPVLFDSSAQKGELIGGAVTTPSIDFVMHVNPSASNVVALVGVSLVTNVSLTGATIGVTFGGEAMSLLGTRQYWNSNKTAMLLFILNDPPTGTQTIVVSGSSVPADGGGWRVLQAVAGTWSQVDMVGDLVAATVTSTALNEVTVPSVLPAHRVISLHGADGTHFPTFDGVKRAYARYLYYYSWPSYVAGELLLLESPGAASVTPTADMSAPTALWAAVGVSAAPTVVDAGAALSVGVADVAAAGGIYRTATPSPERTWVIHGLRPDSKGL